jgi:hypothetical protein
VNNGIIHAQKRPDGKLLPALQPAPAGRMLLRRFSARRLALGAALSACLAFGFSLSAQPQKNSTAPRDHSRLPVVTLPETGNFQFVALGDLADFLDLRTF